MFSWDTGELQLPDITLKRNLMLQDVVNVYGSDVRIFVKEPYLVTSFKRAIDIGEGLILCELLFSSKGKLKQMVFQHQDITDNTSEEMLTTIQEQLKTYPVDTWGTIELNDEKKVVISWQSRI